MWRFNRQIEQTKYQQLRKRGWKKRRQIVVENQRLHEFYTLRGDKDKLNKKNQPKRKQKASIKKKWLNIVNFLLKFANFLVSKAFASLNTCCYKLLYHHHAIAHPTIQNGIHVLYKAKGILELTTTHEGFDCKLIAQSRKVKIYFWL